jgi:hypothetical protein
LRALFSALAIALLARHATVFAPRPLAPPAPVVPVVAPEEGSFLFDVLRELPYRLAWDKLMKEVQPTPDWLLQFNKNYDGVTGGFKAVDIGGKPYRLSFVCKPENCGDRKFEVMFDIGEIRAYGALGGRTDPPAFYGAPPQDVQDALAKGFGG